MDTEEEINARVLCLSTEEEINTRVLCLSTEEINARVLCLSRMDTEEEINTWRVTSDSPVYTQQVEISLEQSEESQKRAAAAAAEAKAPRQRPVWLTESTVQGAYSEADTHDNTAAEVGAGSADDGQSHGPAKDENEEVMRALLIHEKRGAAAAASSAPAVAALNPRNAHNIPAANHSDSDSDTSESDEEAGSRLQGLPTATAAASSASRGPAAAAMAMDEDEDEFEEVSEEPTVHVGGRAYSYSEVSQKPELVELMSAQEKEAYIEMGRNLFQDMYF
ncbi:general transcription factor IIE subunit 1-like [Clupea harengus]|uniref:General transcription factor IIE subunit 1-like n=1 Tax=Clupea harengus TaxID=7950 RepID=A0A6P8GF74_CLUHA|nr:general transcription factor IIE subunit 1-like [Clupea harengus]